MQFVEAAVEAKPSRSGESRSGSRGLRSELPGGAHADIGSSQEAEIIVKVLRALEKKGVEAVPC